MSLAIVGLFFNLAILKLGYSRSFLGLLNTVNAVAAGALSMPLWWLIPRIGQRRAMLVSAILNMASVCALAFQPSSVTLVGAMTLLGISSVMFQLSAAPFMM